VNLGRIRKKLRTSVDATRRSSVIRVKIASEAKGVGDLMQTQLKHLVIEKLIAWIGEERVDKVAASVEID
jgi:hypothetical protein